jgi:hypothetical protein
MVVPLRAARTRYGYIAWATAPGAPDPAAGLNQTRHTWLSPAGH